MTDDTAKAILDWQGATVHLIGEPIVPFQAMRTDVADLQAMAKFWLCYDEIWEHLFAISGDNDELLSKLREIAGGEDGEN